MLKRHPTPVVIFYHTIGGITLAGIYIVIECIITGEKSRLTEYTGRQYLLATACSFFDAGSLIMGTLAFQKDSSGFISLLSFMSIVWSYLFDQFMFDEQIDGLSLMAALSIIAIAIFITVYKIRAKNKEEKFKSLQ